MYPPFINQSVLLSSLSFLSAPIFPLNRSYPTATSMFTVFFTQTHSQTCCWIWVHWALCPACCGCAPGSWVARFQTRLVFCFVHFGIGSVSTSLLTCSSYVFSLTKIRYERKHLFKDNYHIYILKELKTSHLFRPLLQHQDGPRCVVFQWILSIVFPWCYHSSSFTTGKTLLFFSFPLFFSFFIWHWTLLAAPTKVCGCLCCETAIKKKNMSEALGHLKCVNYCRRYCCCLWGGDCEPHRWPALDVTAAYLKCGQFKFIDASGNV